MTTVRRHAYVPFSPQQMFDLVNDVAAYPQFLPWCAGAEVLAAEPGHMRARLRVKKGPLDASFATDNELDPGRSIRMGLVEGPFSRFRGHWRFASGDGGTMVTLELEFEFSGKLVSRVLAAAFKPIADSMVEAFKTRAFEVYGR